MRNRKHQCPTCALTVCCTEQHTRRTWTPRLDFAVCNWQAPSDAGEKVHETVEQEMHLLNGYLRKLLVRYIGALLTRLPVALNWEPKPACATQITCPMAFLGILYDSACALHTPCSCSETGSHPHPAQASWERCRAVAHREDHPVRAGGLGEPRLAPDV